MLKKWEGKKREESLEAKKLREFNEMRKQRYNEIKKEQNENAFREWLKGQVKKLKD